MEPSNEQELSEAEKDLLELADISTDKLIGEIKANKDEIKSNEETDSKIS